MVHYFSSGECLIDFVASGFGHASGSNHAEFLCRKLGGDEDRIAGVLATLQNTHILDSQKGMSSPGGKEYEYGLTEFARTLYE